MLPLFALILVMSPCDYVDVGIASYSKWRRAEVGMENPLATLEAGVIVGKSTIYFQHISGITTKDDGYGINLIGVKYRIK